jgi:outer membrane protein TolC
LPVLTLSSTTTYNRNKASGGFFLTNQTVGPNIGLGVAIPIYNSNIYKTQLNVNVAEQKRQQLEIERLNNELLMQLQVYYQEYDNALKVLEIESGSVRLADENNFIATERFRKLQSNSIELRQAQLSLIEAQNRLINAQFRAKIAATQLRLLAGEL